MMRLFNTVLKGYSRELDGGGDLMVLLGRNEAVLKGQCQEIFDFVFSIRIFPLGHLSTG
jgi:hypothetical protein